MTITPKRASELLYHARLVKATRRLLGERFLRVFTHHERVDPKALTPTQYRVFLWMLAAYHNYHRSIQTIFQTFIAVSDQMDEGKIETLERAADLLEEMERTPGFMENLKIGGSK